MSEESNKPDTAPETAVAELAEEQERQQSSFAKYGKWAIIAVCVVGVPVGGAFMYTASKRAKVRRASDLVNAARNVTQLQKVLEEYPETPAAANAKLSLAKANFDQGNYAAALTTYETFAQEHPDHYLVLAASMGLHKCREAIGTSMYRQGQIIEGRRKLEEARDGYRAFAEANPDHFLAPQAILGEAGCHLQLGRLEDAQVIYEDFIATSTNSPWAQLAERHLASVERDLERTRRGEPARETGITPPASAEAPAAIWQLPERFAP